MLNLLLLRHAKSSWNEPGQDDFDRPLNKRGTKAAAAIGQHLDEADLAPGLVLCSSAVRTRATLTLVLREIDSTAPAVVFDDELYLAEPETILAKVRAIDPQHKTVLVIGHNPGMHALALELAGAGPRDMLAELAMQFPTAALAHLSFTAADWSTILPASGTLVNFVLPRRLD